MTNIKNNNDISYILQEKKLLSSHVLQIFLKPENIKKHIKYRAGQYALIRGAENALVPYSIANAPKSNNHLELHIRLCEQDSQLMQMIKSIECSKKF